MRKENGKKTNFNLNIKLSFLVSLFFVVLIMSMSIGYALYTQVIRVDGVISLNNQGKFKITNVTKIDSSNSNDANPTWTDDSIDFRLSFIRNKNNPVYSATYDISVSNETFYDRLITAFNISFSTLNNNGEDIGVVDYQIVDFYGDDVINPLSEKTYRLIITFTPNIDQSTYDIGGIGEIESQEKISGELTLNSMTPTTGSIKDGRLQRVVINVSSSYQSAHSSSINTNSDKVEVVDRNGNRLGNITVAGNSTDQEFVFYLKAIDGALFPNDTYVTNLSLSTSGLPTLRLGKITLDVNKHEEYVDSTPPVISNVVATQSNEIGVVELSWNGEDDFAGVDSYTVIVLDGDGNEVKRLNNITDTSVSINDLSDGTNASTYNFKVFGKDNIGNVASDEDINNCTTSSGYCSMSGNGTYQWVFSIIRNINYLNFSGENSVNIGNNYSARLTSSSGLFRLPNSITVKMGDTTLTAGRGYTYDSSNGQINITNVTGNITITANGVFNITCLVEGTKVLMADGSYKNVEDISYDDLMAVWSYNSGSLVEEYPIWIENETVVDQYLQLTFSDNTTLKVSGDHGIYNYDLGMFISVLDNNNLKVGSRIAKVKNGKLKIVKITDMKYIKKNVKVYHIISSYYFNIISDDVITTDRNLMISNQYGFTKNITWPNKLQYKISHDANHLYKYGKYSDFMPYYMFKGLRVNEGKYLVDIGLITDEELRMYLYSFPANPDYYKKVEVNKNSKRLWMVTTSLDKVTEKNKNKYKVVEGTYYKLPNKKGIKCYRNSIDNKCYLPNDRVKVYSGMHFVAIYK